MNMRSYVPLDSPCPCTFRPESVDLFSKYFGSSRLPCTICLISLRNLDMMRVVARIGQDSGYERDASECLTVAGGGRRRGWQDSRLTSQQQQQQPDVRPRPLRVHVRLDSCQLLYHQSDHFLFSDQSNGSGEHVTLQQLSVWCPERKYSFLNLDREFIVFGTSIVLCYVIYSNSFQKRQWRTKNTRISFLSE